MSNVQTPPNIVAQSQGWSAYQTAIYSSRKPAIYPLEPELLEESARAILSADAFAFVAGSAGTGATCRANLEAIAKVQIVPRMLRDATIRDTRTTLFGTVYPSPLILSTVSVQGLFHPDAELASAKAASKLGVPFMMSTAASRSIEDIAKASGDGPRWYQLYWPKSDDLTISLLNRAKVNGFTTLVLTLDNPILGWRPKDLAIASLPFVYGMGCQVGFSDPVFMSRFNAAVTHEHPVWPYHTTTLGDASMQNSAKMQTTAKMSAAWTGEIISGSFRTWEDIKSLRKLWDGPIVLKGIQSVQDAEKALEIGVEGISVSNHGGRQVDGAIGSLTALQRICDSPSILRAQRDKRFTVLFDSGIRTGSDILKAIAVGAQGVLLGRPYIYGLALGGEDGVEHVIRSLLCELELTMALSGHATLGEVDRSSISF